MRVELYQGDLRRLPERKRDLLYISGINGVQGIHADPAGFLEYHHALGHHIHLAAVADTERAAAIRITMFLWMRIQGAEAYTAIVKMTVFLYIHAGKSGENDDI